MKSIASVALKLGTQRPGCICLYHNGIGWIKVIRALQRKNLYLGTLITTFSSCVFSAHSEKTIPARLSCPKNSLFGGGETR